MIFTFPQNTKFEFSVKHKWDQTKNKWLNVKLMTTPTHIALKVLPALPGLGKWKR